MKKKISIFFPSRFKDVFLTLNHNILSFKKMSFTRGFKPVYIELR
jgi:hypothetical protein